MSGNQRLTLYVVLMIAIFIFGWAVWPTRYKYDHVRLAQGASYPVRFDRITGRTEILFDSSGWLSIGGPTASKKRLPREELKKLDGDLSIKDGGAISAQIYNGTERVLDSVTVEVRVMKQKGTPSTGNWSWESVPLSSKLPISEYSLLLSRKYKLIAPYGGRSLVSSEFTGNSGKTIWIGQDYEWYIVDAEYN